MSGRVFRSAVAWTAAGQVVSLALTLGLDAVRARMFSANDVGLFVVGLWLLGLVQTFGEGGIGALIVSEQDLSKAQLAALIRAARWMAFTAALSMLCGAPAMALWTRKPEAALLAAALAPAALASGLAVVPRGVLAKRMDFRAIARADMAAVVLQFASTAALAWARLGPWALVLGVWCGQIPRLFLLRRAAGRLESDAVDTSRLSSQIRHAGNITGSRLLSYGYSNGDYFVLSRFAPLRDLASYFNAFRLATLPALLVSNVLQQVAFSAFAATTDRAERRERFRASLAIAFMFALPAAVGLFLTAPLAVRAIYGSTWSDVVPTLRVLALVGFTRSIQIIGPALLLALGRSRTNLVISTAYLVLLVPAFIAGVRHGAVGVALAWAMIATPLDLWVLWLSCRSIDLPLSSVGRLVLSPLAGTACMAAAVYAVVRWASPWAVAHGPLGVWLVLIGAVVVGAAVYAGWLSLRSPELLRALRRSA